MVSTKDSESFDPGSNPGKSFIIFRGHGATAARRIPDPKVGGSNPSGLMFFSFFSIFCSLEKKSFKLKLLQVKGQWSSGMILL